MLQISIERVEAAARNIAITGDPKTSAQVLERFIKTLPAGQQAAARGAYRTAKKERA